MPNDLQKLYDIMEREDAREKESKELDALEAEFYAEKNLLFQEKDHSGKEWGPGAAKGINKTEQDIIDKQYPTLDKWMDRGKRRFMLSRASSKLGGGPTGKWGRELDDLIDAAPSKFKGMIAGVKAAVKANAEVNQEVYGHPWGELKSESYALDKLKTAADWLTNPEKRMMQKKGWEWLVEGLSETGKGLARNVKHIKARYDRGDGATLPAVERDAREELAQRMSSDFMQRKYDEPRYLSPIQLHRSKKWEALRHNSLLGVRGLQWGREYAPLHESGRVKPDPAEFDPEA